MFKLIYLETNIQTVEQEDFYMKYVACYKNDTTNKYSDIH